MQTTQDDTPICHLSVPTRSCRLRRSGLSSVTGRCHRPAPPVGLCPSRSSGTRRASTPLTPGNYNSQQAAGRRGAGAVREGAVVLSMATVLSRALKLPGKGCAPAGRAERRPGRGSRAQGSSDRGRHECRCLRAAERVAIVMRLCGVRPGGAGRGGPAALGGTQRPGQRRGARRASCVAEGSLGCGPVRGMRGRKGGANLSDRSCRVLPTEARQAVR